MEEADVQDEFDRLLFTSPMLLFILADNAIRGIRDVFGDHVKLVRVSCTMPDLCDPCTDACEISAEITLDGQRFALRVATAP